MSAEGEHSDTEIRLHCPMCGYNLRGLPDGKCPECGTPFERDTLARMDQPTVSMGAIRLFAVIWPAVYLVIVVPPTAVVLLAIWLFLEELMGGKMNQWFFPALFYIVLTVVVCWPVCKDLARQTARYKRMNDDEYDTISARRLFIQYMLYEVGTILLLSLGVLWLFG